MQFLAVLSLVSSVAAVGRILSCNQGGCTGSCSTQTLSNPDPVPCHQLGGIVSTRITSVDNGCSFTIYTDSNCSQNPTAIGLGVCLQQLQTGIRSYSYDC